MKKDNKSNFCIRPFNSSFIETNGEIKMCCATHPISSEFHDAKQFNIKETNIKDWWESEYLKYVRKNFLENKKLKECSSCWRAEEAGLVSHRINSNHEYKVIFQNNYEKYLKLLKKDKLSFPEDMELQITNLCNLKCQMCTGAASSRLLVENNALGFENLNQQDYVLNDSSYIKINEILDHDISLINLRGGEPFFNKRIIEMLLKMVENKKANNIKLHITTNGTICNDNILDILKNFKNVRLMVSVEGVGGYNDYMRFPSKWQEINDNILKFKKLNNVYIYVNSVVQNLNLLYLDKLVDYCYENNFFLNFTKLYSPQYLDILNLPKNILVVAYKKLSTIEEKKLIHTNNLQEILAIIKEYLENYHLDKNKYQEFVNMIKKRDNYRKVHIKDYMPELAVEIYK